MKKTCLGNWGAAHSLNLYLFECGPILRYISLQCWINKITCMGNWGERHSLNLYLFACAPILVRYISLQCCINEKPLGWVGVQGGERDGGPRLKLCVCLCTDLFWKPYPTLRTVGVGKGLPYIILLWRSLVNVGSFIIEISSEKTVNLSPLRGELNSRIFTGSFLLGWSQRGGIKIYIAYTVSISRTNCNAQLNIFCPFKGLNNNPQEKVNQYMSSMNIIPELLIAFAAAHEYYLHNVVSVVQLWFMECWPHELIYIIVI